MDLVYTDSFRAARNPGGKKTPQESEYQTPNVDQLHPIQDLLVKVTAEGSQSALKELVRHLYT